MEQLPDVAQLPLHFPDAAQRRYELIRPVLLAECTATERATQTHHHPDTIGKLKRRFEQQGMLGLFPASGAGRTRERRRATRRSGYKADLGQALAQPEKH